MVVKKKWLRRKWNKHPMEPISNQKHSEDLQITLLVAFTRIYNYHLSSICCFCLHLGNMLRWNKVLQRNILSSFGIIFLLSSVIICNDLKYFDMQEFLLKENYFIHWLLNLNMKCKSLIKLCPYLTKPSEDLKNYIDYQYHRLSIISR